MPRKTVPMLVNEGAALLRDLINMHGRQSNLNRRIAEVVVQLRQRFPAPDGQGWDVLGRSFEYRQCVADMYRKAGVPEDSMASLMAGIRYHVSEVIRDQLTPEELRHYGLQERSFKDRKQRTPEHMLRLDMRKATPAEACEGIGRLAAHLRKVDTSTLDRAGIEQVRLAAKELNAVLDELAGTTAAAAVPAAPRRRSRQRVSLGTG